MADNKGLDDANFNHALNDLLNSINPIPSSHHFSTIDIIFDESFGHVKSTDLGGLIIETRKCTELKFVIRNFFEELNRPLILITSELNYHLIKDNYFQEMMRLSLLKIIFIKYNSLSSSDYNKLLLSKRLWAQILFKKVLIFQTDSLICKNSDYSISDFLHFDCIGPAWDRNRPIGLVIDGGSGGFTLRDVKLSIDILSMFSVDNWPGGEDGFYAFYFDLIGAKVGRFEDCLKFCTQEFFAKKSYGCHKVELLKKESRINFYKYETNITKIMNNGVNN